MISISFLRMELTFLLWGIGKAEWLRIVMEMIEKYIHLGP
jgi:hypothetical protein